MNLDRFALTEVNEMLCEQRLKLRRSEKKNAAAPPQDFATALGAETLNEISSLLGSQDFSQAVDFDSPPVFWNHI